MRNPPGGGGRRTIAAAIAGAVLATAATAGAAGLITGKQVKDGSIGLRDLSPAVRGALKKAGTTGVRGTVGPQGPTGPQGPAGTVTTSLPAGQTLRGAFNMDAIAVTADRASQGGDISFALALHAAPTVVVRASDAVPDAQCPGTVGSPQAAPGVLCVYVNGTFNLEPHPAAPTGVRILDFPDEDMPAANTFGAEMLIFSAAAGRFFANGTWAVTGD